MVRKVCHRLKFVLLLAPMLIGTSLFVVFVFVFVFSASSQKDGNLRFLFEVSTAPCSYNFLQWCKIWLCSIGRKLFVSPSNVLSPYSTSLSTWFFLSSSVKDSGVFRKTPPSAKQHYIKQARYFPGQKNAASGAAGGVTYGRKPSYGNVGGNTYVPSFQSSTYAAGAQNRAGGMCWL